VQAGSQTDSTSSQRPAAGRCTRRGTTDPSGLSAGSRPEPAVVRGRDADELDEPVVGFLILGERDASSS
jgi:hypothetical protein